MRPDVGVAQAVDGPDEAHHELVLGALVDIARLPGLLDPAVVEHHDLLGDLHRLLLVVGNEDRRHVHVLVQAAKPCPQLLAHLRVEGAEGLVEQEHLRLYGEGARERHALTLATRELGWVALGELIEMHQLEKLPHAAIDLVLPPLADREPAHKTYFLYLLAEDRQGSRFAEGTSSPAAWRP